MLGEVKLLCTSCELTAGASGRACLEWHLARESANKRWTGLAGVSLSLAPEISLSCLGVRDTRVSFPAEWLASFVLDAISPCIH